MSDELDGYIKAIQKHIQALKNLEVKDREDANAALEQCIEHINASTLGWAKWLSKHQTMKNFTAEELSSYVEKMKKIAIDFLELDVEATQLFAKKVEEKVKEAIKEEKKQEKEKIKHQYVA